MRIKYIVKINCKNSLFFYYLFYGVLIDRVLMYFYYSIYGKISHNGLIDKC